VPAGRRQTGETELFRKDVKIGFSPIHENEPWIGQVSLELKEPCHFLDGKECSIHPGRPISCALFPEVCFIAEHPELIFQKDIFLINNSCSLIMNMVSISKSLVVSKGRWGSGFLQSDFLRPLGDRTRGGESVA
jgi:hypothetical protein